LSKEDIGESGLDAAKDHRGKIAHWEKMLDTGNISGQSQEGNENSEDETGAYDYERNFGQEDLGAYWDESWDAAEQELRERMDSDDKAEIDSLYWRDYLEEVRHELKGRANPEVLGLLFLSAPGDEVPKKLSGEVKSIREQMVSRLIQDESSSASLLSLHKSDLASPELFAKIREELIRRGKLIKLKSVGRLYRHDRGE